MAQPEIERDIILDHNYDGIQEYDNPMPGWWVWLFNLSILFCLPYIMWFHLGKGPSIHDQLDAEVAAYGQMLIEKYGELEPDAATILGYMSDEPTMAAMRGLYQGKCATCHAADGSGGTGPNLTDDHWINVKEVEDIATILMKGVEGKAMPAWENTLTTTQIVLLSSYVANLRNNPQEGKAPEGVVIPAWPDPSSLQSPATDENEESTPAESTASATH